ncbi:MAG: SDR family oxidoreductase [Betaproteobacteria bacterium]|nr:SDR family oxidoreductase [Betaproteobacteria bacterium]
MKLKDQVAIVTGAASGFGAEISRRYIAEGAKVMLSDINEKGAQELAATLGSNAAAVRCDVSKKADIENLVAATVKGFGTLDIVVNNAGYTHKNQSMLTVDEETFDRMMAINVKSIYLMTLATVPIMRAKRRGNIINIGSVAGMRPRPGLVWYSASKAAVNLMSKAMAVELGPDNIRVNAIAPVMSPTGLIESFMGMPDTPENRKKFLGNIPLGRLATPTDIAKAAVYLASDDSDFITGVEFPVDGGRAV